MVSLEAQEGQHPHQPRSALTAGVHAGSAVEERLECYRGKPSEKVVTGLGAVLAVAPFVCPELGVILSQRGQRFWGCICKGGG